MAKRTVVYTMGYQGLQIREFVRKLKAAGVGVVADVRERPVSRFKPDFSKNRLAAHLGKAGMEYVHVRSAGNGKDSLAAYRQHLKRDRRGVDDLRQVIRDAAARKLAVCLTCYEGEVEECHRSVLVDALGREVKAIHL